MAFKDSIAQLISTLFFENPAKNKTYPQLRSILEDSHRQLQVRLATSKANPELLRHVISIEKWAQNRLRSSLNEVPLGMDRSGNYAPDAALGWPELRLEFDQTRRATLELVHRLETGKPIKVAHNQFGSISAKAWLWYLNMHANMELRRLRPG
jgi:hypothetical protein